MFKNLAESAKGFINPDQVTKLAKGVKFPSNKKDLLASFKSNNAPKEILSALDKLPDKTYNSPQDLIAGLKDTLGK